MTDDTRESSGDEASSQGEEGGKVPARTEPPSEGTPSRETDRLQTGDFPLDDYRERSESDYESEEYYTRARRAGDDAPPPRWRDRRSRAVGWRSRDVVRAMAIALGVAMFALLVWRTSQLWLVTTSEERRVRMERRTRRTQAHQRKE